MGTNYAIYIEDYVLSYLKREVDSLELSEIFFYGKRENGGRKFLVYGAGRSKEIAAFASYELLDELVCRLTQAGPVFMVRERNGDYKTSGFQTFYANNEAMQNYLIEWTGIEVGCRTAVELDEGREKAMLPRQKAVVNEPFQKEGKSRTGSAMSLQLDLILVVLVAIVISSTNSYRKMERLNQSAKEVFFAIENQEAGQESMQKDTSKPASAADVGVSEKRTEVLVERDRSTDNLSVEDAVRAENAARVDAEQADAVPEDATDDGQTENGTQNGKDSTDSDTSAQGENTAASGTLTQTEDAAAVSDSTQTKDSSEEALSRNITRYYEVERGDTLYTISQKIYGDASRVEKICELNEISNPDKISEGQKIILP